MNFQKNNLFIISIATVLALSACGGGDSDSNNMESSDGVIFFNLFDTKYNPSSQTDGIKRIQWVYKTGDRELNQKDIVDVNPRQVPNHNEELVLGNNFESVLSKYNIQVEGNTITVPMKDNLSGNTETYSIELQPIDISGMSRDSFDATSNTGIFTYLDIYDKIPASAVFPNDSLCYVLKENSTTPFYVFSTERDATNYPSLNDWISAYTDDNTIIREEQTQLGSTNQYPVVRLVYDTDPSKDMNYSAVNYKDTIYDADYVHQGSVSENIDPSKGIVECTIVNNVAANFLEEQIIMHYN